MTKENSMWNINLKKLAGVKELISALEKYHFIVETIHKDIFWFSHERNGVLVIDYARAIYPKIHVWEHYGKKAAYN